MWFVAENPSLTQVRKLRGLTSPEVQWSASAGDQLFRRALHKAGFKVGDPTAPGGWRCWITDVIKSAEVVKEWQQRSTEGKLRVAEAWAPVLAHELKKGQPRLLVVLGGNADKLLGHLESLKLIPDLPPRTRIHHYSYIAMRPEKATGRGPGDPERVAEWESEFLRVVDLLGR